MAKSETTVKGSIDKFIPYLKTSLQGSSISASIEGESYLNCGNVKIAMLSFERYSWFGSNRVAMTVTAAENNGEIAVIAMTAGGSQATLFKINTVGENSFLQKFIDSVNTWKDEH